MMTSLGVFFNPFCSPVLGDMSNAEGVRPSHVTMGSAGKAKLVIRTHPRSPGRKLQPSLGRRPVLPQAFTVVVYAFLAFGNYYFLAASTGLGGFMKNAAMTKPTTARMATGMNMSSTSPNMSLE